MSRIVTDKYLNKLNTLIEEFGHSPKLSSLVDFFISEVQKDLNRKGSKNQKIFSSNNFLRFNEINDFKELRKMIAYLNLILKSFTGKYLHIHINADLSENQLDNLITLFAWDGIVAGSYDKDLLLKESNNLRKTTESNLTFPADNNKHIINKIYRERFGLKHRLKLISYFIDLEENHVNNGFLLNLNTSARNCVNLSEFSEFPESFNFYMNFGESSRNIFVKLGENKVSRLSTIINLFPSVTGQNIWYKDFIRDEISRYLNFKKVITITAGERTSELLLEMQKQNKFQAEEIYTLFIFEL
jgi:hypothetical protein